MSENLTVSASFPKIYHVKRGQQILWTLIIIFLGVGFWLIARPEAGDSPLLWYVYAVMLGLGINQLNDLYARIILSEDRIERVTWFGKKQMMRADVVSISRMPRSSQYMLLPVSEMINDGIRVPGDINEDELWKLWIATIPNSDSVKEKTLVADVKNHPELGRIPEERNKNLTHATNFSKWLNRTSYCAAFSGFIPPVFHSFTSYLLILIPWVALHNLYKQTSTYAKLNSYGNPIVGNISAIIISGLFLGVFSSIWQYYEIPTSEITHLLTLSYVFAVPLVAITIWCIKPLHWALICLVCPFIALAYEAYGAGVILKIDTAFDSSVPNLYTPTITEKLDNQKGGPALRLSSWWKESGYWQISVSQEFYDSVHVNGNVCIHLHSGFFGVPWYTMTAGRCI